MKLRLISGIGLILFVLATSCQSDEQIEFARYYSAGSLLYQNKCQNCHGKNGEGLLLLIPPLTDSIYLKTKRSYLACAVKYGLKGKINLSNKIFDGEMASSDLAPIEIAGVLTYVTNSFGNRSRTFTSQQVENDLRKCR